MIEPHSVDPMLYREILLAIRDRPENRPARLPEFDHVAPDIVQELVERLTRVGLVEGTPDRDGRTVPVQLTPAGQGLLGQHLTEARWLEAQKAVDARGWKRALREVRDPAALVLELLLEGLSALDGPG